MVDPGLTPFGAGVPGADDADEGPPAVDLGHEGAAGVPLAGVPAAVVVAGAHHLVVDDDTDALVAMPPLALSVIDGGDIYYLNNAKMLE